MGTIEYRELTNFDEFRECVSLQKEILGVSDVDVIPPPILNMFARKSPPIGIVVGAVDKSQEKEKLVGFFFGTAVLQENAIYGIAIGVLPEYLGKNIGLGIFCKFREFALTREIKYMYGNYDPLEGNLGHNYFNKLGFWGIKYHESLYELAPAINAITDFPIDKIAVKWDLGSKRTSEKLEGIYQKKKIEEIMAVYPIVNENKFEESEAVLMIIPEDFMALKKRDFKEALKWRLSTRKILNEYINNRGYWITEFYSQKEDGKRHNYYLLEKQ